MEKWTSKGERGRGPTEIVRREGKASGMLGKGENITEADPCLTGKGGWNGGRKECELEREEAVAIGVDAGNDFVGGVAVVSNDTFLGFTLKVSG